MLFDSAAKLKAAALALVLTDLDLPKNDPLAVVDMSIRKAKNETALSLYTLIRILSHA